MENNIYLDKVVEFIVRDTKIDHDKEEIFSPFYPLPSTHPHHFHLHTLSSNLLRSFSKYCKSVYGLTGDEVKHVWNQYKDIIKDKISNK